jgi:type II secretory pathway pseudopilin PulG
MESLAVLAMVAILVVTASPTFVRLLRDRRVNRAAMHLVDYYRTARTRAIGRGQPMVVQWNAAGGITNTQPGTPGLLRLIEPNVWSAGAAPNCSQIDPTNFQPPGTVGTNVPGSAGVSEVSRMDFKNGYYTYTNASFNDDATPQVAHPFAEVCFSPSGRSYIRFSSGTAFRPVVGVASFAVRNIDVAVTNTTPCATGEAACRTVFLPPNGVARMSL